MGQPIVRCLKPRLYCGQVQGLLSVPFITVLFLCQYWKVKKKVNQMYAHQTTPFLASDLKKEVNNLDKSYKRRGKPRIWNVLLYFENRKLWSLKRKIPQKKKRNNKKCF